MSYRLMQPGNTWNTLDALRTLSMLRAKKISTASFNKCFRRACGSHSVCDIMQGWSINTVYCALHNGTYCAPMTTYLDVIGKSLAAMCSSIIGVSYFFVMVAQTLRLVLNSSNSTCMVTDNIHGSVDTLWSLISFA